MKKEIKIKIYILSTLLLFLIGVFGIIEFESRICTYLAVIGFVLLFLKEEVFRFFYIHIYN